MRVRRATPADHGPIGEVTVAAYQEYSAATEGGYVDHLRDAATRDRQAELWLAEDEASGEVLGTVTLCPVGSPWREIGAEDEAEFRMLAVSPDAQRRGVGSALMDVVVRRAREDGMSSIVLSSLDGMTAAHRVYERLGFERVPERDWSPAPDVRLLAFRKEL